MRKAAKLRYEQFYLPTKSRLVRAAFFLLLAVVSLLLIEYIGAYKRKNWQL
jgi:hypothetical protein